MSVVDLITAVPLQVVQEEREEVVPLPTDIHSPSMPSSKAMRKLPLSRRRRCYLVTLKNNLLLWLCWVSCSLKRK